MNGEDTGFSEFNGIVETVLNELMPIKKKYVRANGGPFMIKALRKAICTRTDLCIRCNKSQENWNAFKKQLNRCAKMLRQAKINYNKTLDHPILLCLVLSQPPEYPQNYVS